MTNLLVNVALIPSYAKMCLSSHMGFVLVFYGDQHLRVLFSEVNILITNVSSTPNSAYEITCISNSQGINF